MLDNNDEVTVEFRDLGIKNIDTSNLDEYENFVNELISNIMEIADNEGLSPASVIARTVMTMFRPGVVIVASPGTETDSEGHEIPDDIAIAILGNSNYTNESVRYILYKLAEGLDHTSNEDFQGFFDREEKYGEEN